MAIHLLDTCRQLRSFSAELYGHEQLYGDPKDGSIAASSIMSSTRIHTGLTAMKKLNLGKYDHYWKDFGSTFLELLLPCCPNLHTFSFDFNYCTLNGRPLDPDWWIRVFASNNKLKRISLQLGGNRRSNRLSEDVLQRFQLLPFFKQLNVNITRWIHRIEFPQMIFYYSIRN
jgi:hypothetical protein